MVDMDEAYGERGHDDSHCDCHWAHPICWHCNFQPPPCDSVVNTTLLYIGAIFMNGTPYFALFCSPCHNSRAAHYNTVPDELVNYYEAYHMLGAGFQAEHGVALHPQHVPGTPVALHFHRINNPEDEYDGFDYEQVEQQDVGDVREWDISVIAKEEEGEGSDPAE